MDGFVMPNFGVILTVAEINLFPCFRTDLRVIFLDRVI